MQWQDVDVCLGDRVTIEVIKEDGSRAPWFRKIEIENYGFYQSDAIVPRHFERNYRFKISSKSKNRRCEGGSCEIQSGLFDI